MDLAKEWATDTIRDALNAYLKETPASILGAAVTSADFHARFSAVERSYRSIDNTRNIHNNQKASSVITAGPMMSSIENGCPDDTT